MTLFINSGKLRGTDSGPFDLPEGLPASGAGDVGSGVEAQVLAEPALRFEVELSSGASWKVLLQLELVKFGLPSSTLSATSTSRKSTGPLV